jgi:hypothetical protein
MKSFLLLISLVVFLFCSVSLFAAGDDNPSVSDSWLKEAIENIEKEEYKPSLQELDYRGEKFAQPKFHLANRANNLRAYFDENGMELISRVIEDEEKWNLKIKSIEVTSGKEEKIFSDLDVAIDGENIVCTGDGIEIVYSNSESGIQQHISIIEAKRIDLVIEKENLNITSEENKFVLNSENQVVVYQVSLIEDGTDKEISYSLLVDKDKLSISMDGRDIVYPINISANITSDNSSVENLSTSTTSKSRGLSQLYQDWQTGGPVEKNAQLGFSVSEAGDVNGDGYSDLIVGTPFYDNGQIDEGGAFVYHAHFWGISDYPDWTAEGNQPGIQFGYCVATANDVNDDGYSDVIVGARSYTNVQTYEGRAYVYHGSSSGLSLSADWTVEPNQENAFFGSSVSSAGDVNGDGYSDIIVGAPSYDNGEDDEGMAFVYHGSSLGLSTTSDWTGESNQAYAGFAQSVSTAGDVNGDGYSDVIVGAFGYDGGGGTAEGGAFVYHGSGSSGLSSEPDWIAVSGQELSFFGISVAAAGDVNGDGYSDVIVGANRYDGGETDEGRAFVYYGNSSGLSASADWTAEANQDTSWFGFSVSSAGDVNGDGYSDVIVGAWRYDYAETDQGQAFVYHGSAVGLSSLPDWKESGMIDLLKAHVGWSVSSAGDVNGDGYSDVIVGAPGWSQADTNAGVALVYYGGPDRISSSPGWVGESDIAGVFFGNSVSGAGDVNGDGYSDVIVGANGYDNGQTDEGGAFLYYGGSSGLPASPDWTDEGDNAGAYFGYSVSTAGDVNGDGYSDVIVGAVFYDNGEESEGRAFVYHGSSSGLSTASDWTGESNQAYACFGSSVSSAGDVNGDGYSDVIVGAPYYDKEENDEGTLFLYYGSSSGLSSSVILTADPSQAYAEFGYSVSTAGDVNGDGYSDVIVGAPSYHNGEDLEGMAFVYNGSSVGLDTIPDWTAESNQEEANLGYSVSGAGDVNGDGYSDVIVGAPGWDGAEVDNGRAFVYSGSSTGLSNSIFFSMGTNNAGANFGNSVSTAGDVDGDGYSDVIVGAYHYSVIQTHEGCAWVCNGSPSGLESRWSVESNQADAYYGTYVSTAGDVNGDGYSDVIVGAPYYDNGEDNEGSAFVYFGAGNGLPVIPTQSKEDGSHHVQLGNATGSGGVQLNILGRTPGGRGKVKLQWEIKELGELFEGISISESDSWYDTDTNGIEISEDVTGLSDATAYHWRVRLKYDPVTYSDAIHSRWLSIGPNGWNETDFITTSMAGINDQSDEISNLQLGVFPAISANIFSIRFSISEEEAEEDISLKVYNKAGIMVKSLFRGKKPAGTHLVTLNGDKLPNDVYFISLKKGKKEQLVRKVVLLR